MHSHALVLVGIFQTLPNDPRLAGPAEIPNLAARGQLSHRAAAAAQHAALLLMRPYAWAQQHASRTADGRAPAVISLHQGRRVPRRGAGA